MFTVGFKSEERFASVALLFAPNVRKKLLWVSKLSLKLLSTAVNFRIRKVTSSLLAGF